MAETIPSEMYHLRACLLCGLIKTEEQFRHKGCDNCEGVMEVRDHVHQCTSANFDGMVGMMSPQDSWVARWQRIDQLVKGVYAVSVTGTLSKGIIRELRDKGVIYRSRDTSQK